MKFAVAFTTLLALLSTMDMDTGHRVPVLPSHDPRPLRSHDCLWGGTILHVNWPDPAEAGWNFNAACEDGIWFREHQYSGFDTPRAERQDIERRYVYAQAFIPRRVPREVCWALASDPINGELYQHFVDSCTEDR